MIHLLIFDVNLFERLLIFWIFLDICYQKLINNLIQNHHNLDLINFLYHFKYHHCQILFRFLNYLNPFYSNLKKLKIIFQSRLFKLNLNILYLLMIIQKNVIKQVYYKQFFHLLLSRVFLYSLDILYKYLLKLLVAKFQFFIHIL